MPSVSASIAYMLKIAFKRILVFAFRGFSASSFKRELLRIDQNGSEGPEIPEWLKIACMEKNGSNGSTSLSMALWFSSNLSFTAQPHLPGQ